MTAFIEALFIVLIACAIIQLFIYWIVYSRVAFYKQKKGNDETLPVSVIICAKNESIRLKRNLPLILSQEYPSFEVIVVDDCSWDETGIVLSEISNEYPNLKIVTIKEQEKYKHGKKFALTLGIKAAAHETILLTDADCRPAGKKWISLMIRNYTTGKEIIIGYGPYEKTGGILNQLIRFDAFSIGIQYLSAAINNKAYMGIGRNLSYKKQVFFRSKGFAKHNHILSGDDDLFVNQNAAPNNTQVETDPGSFTYSEPKKTMSEWFRQKKRHMSTASHYKPSDKLSLSLQNGSILLFYISLITLFILKYDWRILLSLYLVVVLARFPVVYKISQRLKEKDLSWSYPALELIHTILQPIFYISHLLTKQKSWK